MAADSFTGGDAGDEGGGSGASGSGGGQISSEEPAIRIMNQLLLNRSRRRKKHSGPQMLPDTPYDASTSNVSNKLREAEAEVEAVNFLMSGIFSDTTGSRRFPGPTGHPDVPRPPLLSRQGSSRQEDHLLQALSRGIPARLQGS